MNKFVQMCPPSPKKSILKSKYDDKEHRKYNRYYQFLNDKVK